MSNLSENVLIEGEAILSAPPDRTVPRLKEALRRFISSDFEIDSGTVFDPSGKSTPRYSIIIYRADDRQGFEAPGDVAIPADRAAVVIEVCDELDAGRFSEAYARVSKVKQLTKSPIPKTAVEARTNVTLGIVFSIKSATSLDSLADELYRLDTETPHKQWLDMLVVAPSGVVNYAVHFPGEGVSGDFLPPTDGAFGPPAPPALYVTIVMRPSGHRSFNKMVAFIIAHLNLFIPEVSAKQVNWEPILEGQPTDAVTNLGFQPDLNGQLAAVPPDGYRGKIVPTKPVLLDGPNGQFLAAITFMKWQTGGVILLQGSLPLEGMLIFLPGVKPEYLRVIRRPTHQISPVLPLSQVGFNQFILNVVQRSNFRVRADAGGFVMEKFLEEGTTVPFIARCTLGLLVLRENTLDAQRRENFDKRYQGAFESLRTAREASKALAETWVRHRERVATGDAARVEGKDIRVVESINKSLREEFESFLSAATRSIKTGVQGLCSLLGIDIGFLFKKQSTFETGIQRLQQIDPALANYLLESRKWTERLVLLRNDLEHEIWEFPKVKYSAVNGLVNVSEPAIGGEGITSLVELLLDRAMCFFEEMIAHALQRNLPAGTTITEIALHLRPSECPERFRITLARGGEPPWRISYHASKFDDT